MFPEMGVLLVLIHFSRAFHCFHHPFPHAPCMEYLPTFARTKSPSCVGKYTSPMEHLGFWGTPMTMETVPRLATAKRYVARMTQAGGALKEALKYMTKVGRFSTRGKVRAMAIEREGKWEMYGSVD